DSSTYAVLPDMNGRVFQGTTTVADVCKALEAQLPNITGGFRDNRSDALWPTPGSPNAFWSSGKTEESYD
ncbi:hypothetical protein, partial [Parasutterella secunda]|uniref:hypothetical protein n=1 Tax=Parasutterella secunda TaxID=626947 RepID=UPI001961BC33